MNNSDTIPERIANSPYFSTMLDVKSGLSEFWRVLNRLVVHGTERITLT